MKNISVTIVTVLCLLLIASCEKQVADIVDKEESTLISPQGETAAWEMVKTLPLASKPGIRFDYNQTNYLLLGKIIDTLSGMSFRDFIIRHQLEKAVMVKTIRAGFGANKDIVVHAAAGYRYSRGRLQNMFFSLPPSLQTAAGMSSTATELAQWIIALQSGKLLKPSLLKSLWSPAQLKDGTIAGFTDLINGYAAGWPVIVRKNHPAAAPVGGGRAALLVYPDDDLSIIVLTNLAGATPEIFIDDLAAFYLPGIKNSTRAGK